ncbi:MAG: hypothetical protein LKI58_12105 [Actinomyces sp.]|jgi:hypothetical protein|nr:hypothetical protein [Actinomyces sp.]MCI1788775.1 hypothetical protein [Actinomyces sp.]MCI1830016.1 hypothetical protein [Actinomyces sp.]
MTITDPGTPTGFELLRDALESLRYLEAILTDARGDAVTDIAAAIERHDPIAGDFETLLDDVRAEITQIDYYFNH